MKALRNLAIGAAIGTWAMLLFTGGDCTSGGYAPRVPEVAGCDTTTYERFDAIDSTMTSVLRITCTVVDTVLAPCDTVFVSVPDTVFVEVPGDTVYVLVEPDPDCVADCIEVKGLSHTRECMRGCVPAQ